MSTQIAIRLPDEIVAYLDAQVADGVAKSRADFIWDAIERERRRLTAERDVQVLIAQPYDEFDQLHERLSGRDYPDPH